MINLEGTGLTDEELREDSRGRKPHEPTDVTRKQVEAMVAYGITQDDIAACLNIKKSTLVKYYREEIDTAKAKANANVAARLYNKCMKDETAAIIFWLKTRGGWKEVSQTEHTGVDGAPLEVKFTINWVGNEQKPRDFIEHTPSLPRIEPPEED